MGTREALAVAGVALVAFAVRFLTFADVFVGDGDVILWPADGAYHARLALYSLERFPSFLSFDPYLNYPRGSGVPWPPLFPLALAAICRLFGGSPATLESLLAVSPPVLGALTVVPVYAAARLVATHGVALAAAGIYAFLGVAVLNAIVGNSDHHALVSFVAATLLAIALAALRAERSSRLAFVLALGIARAAVALSWSGSLLYLGLVSAVLLAGFVVAGQRRDLLFLEAGSSLLAAALIAPVVAATDAIPGGRFAVTSLSWSQPISLFAASLVALLVASWDRTRPARSAVVRILRLVFVAGAGLVILLAAIPELRETLRMALLFVGARNQLRAMEQAPLFRVAEFGGSPHDYFGLFAYLIVLTPVAAFVAARNPDVRLPALGLGFLMAVLGALALAQVRFGNDFAPIGAIGFALLLHQLLDLLRRRARLPHWAAAIALPIIAVSLLSPTFVHHFLPELRRAVGAATSDEPGRERALRSPFATVVYFARELRGLTPETGDFVGKGSLPQYGVLALPNLGHAIRYWGRRPASVDGFFEYLDPAVFERAMHFFAADHEGEAIEIARALGGRYVVTYLDPTFPRSALISKLHLADGVGKGSAPSLRHFRMLTEGPPGGTPQYEMVGDPHRVSYKLFEIVEGARLQLRAEPYAEVGIELALRTPMPRTFVYRASVIAGEGGVAEVRVPYPTTATTDHMPVRAEGHYRVSAGERSIEVPVGEDDVRSGARIVVDLAAGPPGRADAGEPAPSTGARHRAVVERRGLPVRDAPRARGVGARAHGPAAMEECA